MKKKALALCLFIVIVAPTMLLIQSNSVLPNTKAQTTPSVPEFTVRLADYSYDVPATTPTYTIDPYTGEQKQATSGSSGYHVENKSIEITIKNQPFTEYQMGYNWVLLSYNVSYKGHYGEDWSYYPYYSSYGIPQSTSDYTNILFPIPEEGDIDIRVQAQIGYYTETGQYALPGGPFSTYTFVGEESGWSNTQTITLTNGATSPEFSSWTILLMLSVMVAIAGLLVYFKKCKHQPTV